MALDDKSKTECRACLETFEEDSNLYNLFLAWIQPWHENQSTIAEDLAKLANVEILQTDKYSKAICEKCFVKLRQAYEFSAMVQANDKVLRQKYPETTHQLEPNIWPQPIHIERNVQCDGSKENNEIQIKQEVEDDDYVSNLQDESVKDPDLGTAEIKVEPEEILEPQSESIDINGIISQSQFVIPNTLNGESSVEDIQPDPLKVKSEPVSEDESEMSPIDLPLECMLCSKTCRSVSGLKAHVIAQHSYKSVKRKTDGNSPRKSAKHLCGTCGRNFVTSTDLMVHETCHNKAVCYGCSQSFDTFVLLSRHRVRCKAINSWERPKHRTLEDVIRPQPEDDRPIKEEEMLSCSLCEAKFTDSYYLSIHEEIQHSAPGQTIHTEESL